MTLALDTTVLGLGDLLNRKIFAVPEHQRTYAWTASEVQDLWQDLITAIKEEPDGYFLGQVVLGSPVGDSKRFIVIDGQQRLATVSLLYAAVAAEFLAQTADSDNKARAHTIEEKYLAELNLVTMDRTYFVQMGPPDNGYFEALLNHAVAGAEKPLPAKDSHELMEAAYEYLRGEVSNYAPEGGSAAVSRLVELASYVKEQLTVIQVEAGSEDNAFVIFETLNDRGVRLTPADLLKNLLFARSKDRLAEVTSTWSAMLGTLEVLDDDGSVTTFIRHYWISTRGPVRDKQLYKTIKDALTSPASVVRFASELSKAAEAYVALSNAESKLWTTTSEAEAVRVVGLFKAKTVRPLILAIAQETKGEQRAKLMTAVANWTVRLAVSGRLGSGTTEEGAGIAARAVREGTAATPAKLTSKLAGSYVADSDFESSFATFKLRNGRQARYLLRNLELQKRKDEGLSAELQPEADEKMSTSNTCYPATRSPARGPPSAETRSLSFLRASGIKSCF